MKKVLVIFVSCLIVLSFSIGVLADPSPVPIDDEYVMNVVVK